MDAGRLNLAGALAAGQYNLFVGLATVVARALSRVPGHCSLVTLSLSVRAEGVTRWAGSGGYQAKSMQGGSRR